MLTETMALTMEELWSEVCGSYSLSFKITILWEWHPFGR